jgi:hypothetical protein
MAEGESAAVIGPTRLFASRVASSFRCDRCETERLVEPSTTPSSSLSISVSRFSEAQGTQSVLEVGFRVDATTLNNTLSTPTEFRVLEGGNGRADLVGRFTTVPIPEPSSAMLVGLAAMGLLRRSRRRA